MTILSFFFAIVPTSYVPSSSRQRPEPGRFAESPERAYTDRNRLQYQHTLPWVQRQENLRPPNRFLTASSAFGTEFVSSMQPLPTYSTANPLAEFVPTSQVTGELDLRVPKWWTVYVIGTRPQSPAFIVLYATNLTIGAIKMSLACGELLPYVANVSSTQEGAPSRGLHKNRKCACECPPPAYNCLRRAIALFWNEPLFSALRNLPMGRWCSRLFTQFCAWLGNIANVVATVIVVPAGHRALLVDHLRPVRKTFTEHFEYPELPLEVAPRYRGFHRFDLTTCIACERCGETAPWIAFTSVKKRWKAGRVSG